MPLNSLTIYGILDVRESLKIKEKDVFDESNFDKVANGLTGYTGSAGGIGDTGTRGYTGSLGYQGSRGALGAQGDPTTGFKGSRGYTGSASTSVGLVGYQGSKGSIGDTGFTGSIGFTGSKGYTGSRLGAVGARGATGFKGSRGYTGSSTGFTGSRGDTGDIGYTGSRGPLGAQGNTGATGFTGSIGPTGGTGIAGFKGSRGYTGSRGSTGFKGSFGYTGSQGLITKEAYKWELIRSRAASTTLSLIGSGATEATFAIDTGTISAGDIIAMELNNSSSVSANSTPKVMMFMIANDSTVTEVDHQHGWTAGNINETPDPDYWYSYLFTFGVAYASTTTLRFDNMYTTTMFWSATSWGSTIFDLTSLSLYGGRIWRLVPNESSDTVSNPSIGAFGTCLYNSGLDISTIDVSVTNNHDESAVIQFDSTSFISSSAQEVVVAAGQSRTFTATFSGNISFSNRTVAARAVVGSKQSSTVTRTESISFCAAV